MNMLLFPPTIKLDSFIVDTSRPKSYYIGILNFKEVQMGTSPENIEFLHDDIQATRRQYGLRHFITGAIHGAMGDTYHLMAIAVSHRNKQLRLWGKGQLIVVISRTRLIKNTIFIGSKRDTILGLKELLLKMTQWSDYIEQVMELATIYPQTTADGTFNNNTTTLMDQGNFPFRMCDISLPQDQTGVVYMLMSKKDTSFVFIDSCFCLRSFLLSHNSNNNSSTNPSPSLRPYILIGYVCGFNKQKKLMNLIKQEWKDQS